ncbi:phage SPO1 DNA polymerase-related protein [Thioalkalivibrio sp. K90mix]|uniref:uracil-DNA glycosylase n=1 Tax=Thioalkalivibrio sp. (strain K90mix) TaxID=396595 RepID=UPI000195A6AF|nr:uracil-DNA glycosylase [Thioalkalivibrio sp. K90mix]ADC72268.1 phage SPO1 DNA polymerase-related protein [Thioalkalivibrio sp. K90mix]
MELSARKRRILADMGIPVWRARDGALPGVPVAAPVAEPPAAPLMTEAESAQAPGAPSETSEPLVSPADVPEEGGVAVLDWPELEARVRECTACAELAAQRTQTVFGVGDRRARWLFVGEAPGAEEDRRGEPFVGRAGQLLDSMLAALGLDRGQDVFIANVLKCRPPNNRDPSPDESRACRGFLDRQIALVQPEVIVALGRIAAQHLLETDQPLGRMRGSLHRYREVPLVVTYHPAYLLRKPQDKAKAWQDLQRARACLTSAPGS